MQNWRRTFIDWAMNALLYHERLKSCAKCSREPSPMPPKILGSTWVTDDGPTSQAKSNSSTLNFWLHWSRLRWTLTKQGRGKSKAKCYLCLFTCLATRAVHLEIAYALDTSSFLNAFTRMTARRGMPSYVVSDNRTNFVGAEKELQKLVQTFDQHEIVTKTTQKCPIEGKFNPPSALHFGGVFEILIKSAKKAQKAIVGDAAMSDKEPHTAICGVKGLLNSRPITYVSSDPNIMVPLTLNHFLVGQLGGQYAPEVLGDEEYIDQKKWWHRVQQLSSQFWRRWRREFLPSLNARRKWLKPSQNYQIGDVVLVVEPNANRGQWPLGRIVEVYPGTDGLIRIVKVKVGKHYYLRPVHRLCPLEVDNRGPNVTDEAINPWLLFCHFC